MYSFRKNGECRIGYDAPMRARIRFPFSLKCDLALSRHQLLLALQSGSARILQRSRHHHLPTAMYRKPCRSTSSRL